MLDVDCEALQRAVATAKRGGYETHEPIVCAYRCQIRSLNLKPWQIPPAYAGINPQNEHDREGQRLLRKMLDAGLSRYDPTPLESLRAVRLVKKGSVTEH